MTELTCSVPTQFCSTSSHFSRWRRWNKVKPCFILEMHWQLSMLKQTICNMWLSVWIINWSLAVSYIHNHNTFSCSRSWYRGVQLPETQFLWWWSSWSAAHGWFYEVRSAALSESLNALCDKQVWSLLFLAINSVTAEMIFYPSITMFPSFLGGLSRLITDLQNVMDFVVKLVKARKYSLCYSY